MSKEKQIKTTDWLTRGISKEQLEREKREAIMSADLQECMTYDEWSAREYGVDSIDFDTTVEKMVAKGYRKQIEGEWEDFEIPRMIRCSECGVSYLGIHRQYFRYCPNCGAKMKGGAE